MTAVIYEKIVRYIDGHIKEEISLDEISRIAGYSKWHIYKIFKIYSPAPIKEYIRNKKIYAAANEIYTGRKLYDVALDYGYETPAGFYKAFQRVFGCKPSEYKNINTNYKTRRNIFMNIEHVKTIGELDECAKIFKVVYADIPTIAETYMGNGGDWKSGREWWIERFNKEPELLLYAKDGDKICAWTFGFGDGGSITVHEGVLDEYWNTGIFEALFIELENRAKKLGYTGVVLGIAEGQEEFYAKLGYTGRMLIQSEKHSVDDLKKVIEGNKNIEITGSGIYDGYINQLWLNVSILDKDIKKKFEVDLGDCWTQIIVSKSV